MPLDHVPFEGTSRQLLEDYETVADPAAFRTTIPTNFDRIRSEVLYLFNELQRVSGGQAGSAPASLNDFFRVMRTGPSIFVANPTATKTFSQNRAAYATPYVGGRVDKELLSTYDYVQSVWPGWMQARQLFADQGSLNVAGQRFPAKLSWVEPATYAFDLQPNVPVGYVPVSGGKDLPGFYQVVTAHMSVVELRGQSLDLRLTYGTGGAIPSGLEIVPYISWSDGTRRYDGVGSALVSATAEDLTVTLSTGSLDPVFPGGVVPETATSIEFGLVVQAATAGWVNLTMTLSEFTLDSGGHRALRRPLSPVLEYLAAAQFYAQHMGPDKTGSAVVNSAPGAAQQFEHPVIESLRGLGGTLPTANNALLIEDYPWALMAPWRKPDASLVPDSRAVEVIGAVARSDAVAGVKLDSATETVTLVVAALQGPDASFPYPVKAFQTALSRTVQVVPTAATSDVLDQMLTPQLEWQGEVQAVFGPLLF